MIDLSSSASSKTSSKKIIKILKDKRKKQIALIYKKQKGKAIRKIPKVLKFRKTIEMYPDDIFYNHFRMSRDTFKKLYNMVEPLWIQNSGRPAYPLEFCLYITLWKLCNMNTFREICDRFGVGFGTAYRIFHKTIIFISKLKKDVIKFPFSPADQRKTIEEFEKSRVYPFPFTIGCIDGMHIKISRPIKDSISFYNRKGFYSIIVQGVANSKFEFIDAFIGYPGRCHDAAVWADSPLKKSITNGTVQIPADYHLLGDGAYPLETYLMVPFRHNGFLSEDQLKFNYVLSSTRVFIEQAFGILKKKFRILNNLELQNLTLAKDIVMACMVTHNIILQNEGCHISDINQNENNDVDSPFNSFTSNRNEAINKRERLKNLLSA